MVSLKIECPCGQHYAFEVEPVMGRMPAPVACPACGEDGTLIANEMISRRTEPAQAPTILVSPLGPRATTAGPPSRHGAPLPGQPSRTQALFEARAKISWGDPPQEVLKYLMIQGFNYEEAG